MNRAPVTFPFEPVPGGKPFRFARIEVTDDALGGNACRPKAPFFECKRPGESMPAFFAALSRAAAESPDLPESLGPSVFDQSVPLSPESRPERNLLGALGPSIFATPEGQPSALGERSASPLPSPRNPYCMESVEIRALRRDEDEECIQRQELRLNYEPPAETPYVYSFRFRMPPEEQIVDRINSIRWVIAQWKEKPLEAKAYKDRKSDWGPSPYLALRFDDGVLHVTVQDEECRCVIASEPHPFKELKGWIPDGEGGSTLPANTNAPPICESSRAEDEPGTACAAGFPHFKVEYGAAPHLTSPMGTWTEMEFQVQAGPSATIAVKQDGVEKAKVTGKIGYQHVKVTLDEKTLANFKIGHYRDYIPYSSVMDIDRFQAVPCTESTETSPCTTLP